MNKSIISEIGKKSFFADDNTFSTGLIYLKGIEKFDIILNQKFHNELKYVVQFIQHSKGLLIKMAKGFSSKSYGLGYDKISEIKLILMTEYAFLMIRAKESDIIFGIENENVADLKDYFKAIRVELKIENSAKVDTEVEEKFKKYLFRYTDVMKIDISKTTSPKWKRLISFIIDSAIIFSLIYYIGYTSPDAFANPLHGILYFMLLTFFYYLILEGAFRTSIGKIVTNTRVTSIDGTKADGIQIFERTLSRLIPLEQFSFLSKDKPGLHDNLSKTIIIDNKKRQTIIADQYK